VGQVAPGARDTAYVRLTAELALGTHLTGHPGHLVGERGELVHHGVDRAPDPQELTAQRPALDLVGHLLRQVTLGDRHDDPGDLGGRPAEVVDQTVDRAYPLGPRALEVLLVDPLGHPALAADYPADPQQLAVAALQQVDDLVEPVGHLARHVRAPGQAYLEVT